MGKGKNDSVVQFALVEVTYGRSHQGCMGRDGVVADAHGIGMTTFAHTDVLTGVFVLG